VVERFILEVVEWEAKEECQKGINEYLQGSVKQKLLASSNMGWSHQQHAGQVVYTLINLQTSQVLFQVVLCKERLQVMAGKEVVICEGNYFRTSQGMEGEAFRRLVDYLNGVRLLPYLHDFVCDQDLSVLSILNSNSRLQHINI
jgi:hypothetical protein